MVDNKSEINMCNEQFHPNHAHILSTYLNNDDSQQLTSMEVERLGTFTQLRCSDNLPSRYDSSSIPRVSSVFLFFPRS